MHFANSFCSSIHILCFFLDGLSSFDDILPIYNTIEGPKYHILGNHDFPLTTDYIVDILDMPNQYYDFKQKNFRFIVLDTMEAFLSLSL